MSNTTKLIIGGVVVWFLLNRKTTTAVPSIPTTVQPVPPTVTPTAGGTSVAQDVGSILSGIGSLLGGVAKAADAFSSPGTRDTGSKTGAGAGDDYTPSESQKAWWEAGNAGPV